MLQMLKISRKFTLCSFRISRRYFVALEAAISTKPTLKLSSMLDMCVSLCGFFVHKLQPKLWRIKHEGVRLWKTAASLLNRAWDLISGFKKAIFFTFSTFLILKKTTNGQNYSKSIGNQYQNFGPVNTYPDILKNRGFFPPFSKNNTHPHVAYLNRFRSSTWNAIKWWILKFTIASFTEHA